MLVFVASIFAAVGCFYLQSFLIETGFRKYQQPDDDRERGRERREEEQRKICDGGDE